MAGGTRQFAQSGAAQPDGLKLLAEIAGKLDVALQKARSGSHGAPAGDAAAPPGTAPAANPDLVRALIQLGTTGDAQQAVELILDSAVAATQADRAFLMILEGGRKLRYKGGRSIDQDTVAAEGALHSKTVIKKVITSGEPVRVEDSTQLMSGEMSESLANLPLRSILCVPVRRTDGNGGTAVGGVLYLDSRAQIHAFTEADQSAVLAIGEAGGAALDRIESGVVPAAPGRGGNGGDAAEVQKLKENITRLLDVGRAIGTTLVLDDLLVLALEKVLEVTKADRGFIMLLEGGKPVFKIGRAWNKKEGAERKSYKLNETQFFFSKTIVNRTLADGKSVCIKDTVGAPEDSSLSIAQMELASVMATPLREKNATLGLIYVDSKASNREFEESDLELFEALAGQAAIALQNAILYTQVKDKSRLESEIQIAAQMQQDMCPRKVPVLPGIDVWGTMLPAKEVGGDYYDFVEDPHQPGKSLSMIIGDVSGKGLGSGIVAVMARCFLRSMITAYGVESPSSLLQYLNGILSADLKPGMFMTMLMVVWDTQRKTIRYAAAGHEHIVVYRAKTRTAEAIVSGGRPLGLSASTGPTPDAEIKLASGDALVLYSDGVTEAMNANEEEFTLERLLEVVKDQGPSALAAAHLGNSIADDVKSHVGDADQSDDITLVVLRKT